MRDYAVRDGRFVDVYSIARLRRFEGRVGVRGRRDGEAADRRDLTWLAGLPFPRLEFVSWASGIR